MRVFFWRALTLIWLPLWYLSWLQVVALFGGYSPVLIILTPSDMPYLPPLSIVFMAPTPPPADGKAYPVVDYYDTAIGLKLPVVHYAYYDHQTQRWYYYIPNAKAQLEHYTTLWAPVNYILDMLPPYYSIAMASEMRWQYHGVFAIPGYVVWILQALVLKAPPMVYKFRRVL